MPESASNFLADRLNSEPVIFRGCSSSELQMLALVAAAIWLPLSLLFATWMGRAMMGAGVAMLGVIGTVFVGATLFQRIKRNRPEGYYQLLLRLRLEDLGLWRTGLVRRSGSWDIGRR